MTRRRTRRASCATSSSRPGPRWSGWACTRAPVPGRLTFHADPVAAVDGAGFVQENGPERIEVKVDLFRRVDAVLPPDVLIASSSSTLLPSAMQAGCRHPERLVLGHPFNPPHLIPLVEVAGGAATSPDAMDRAMRFYAALGKHPIRLNKEIAGHVSNRLQAAVWREAAYLVEQGVVSVADVDAAISQGPGLRWAIMGPIMTYHLGGGAGGTALLDGPHRGRQPVAGAGHAGDDAGLRAGAH